MKKHSPNGAFPAQQQQNFSPHINNLPSQHFDEVGPSISGRSTPASIASRHSNVKTHPTQFPPLIPSPPPAHLIPTNDPALKEQLQLHLQTIGILVAEKAELQSKQQQYQKKSDMKQDECDELLGRLRASRQKITELEKQVQQLQQEQQITHNQQSHNNNTNSDSNNNINNNFQYEIQRLNNELNSKDLLINELKVLLAESNEKLNLRQIEMQKLSQVTLDLKSHLEIAKMRESSGLNYEDEILKLRELNSQLESKLNVQKRDLNDEHASLNERYKKQIESLVDQINKLTDERDDTFNKIDNLQRQVKNLSSQNKDLNLRLEESIANKQQEKLAESNNSALIQAQIIQQQKERESQSKIDLLENEIKYFKSQIEILLRENQEFAVSLDKKEQSVINLKKILENYESDREKFNTLLEQNHSDKQTLSRCLKQNNELKEQLTELQDAYVKLTNTNLEIATKLEAEQFKFKQLSDSKQETNVAKEESVKVNSDSNVNQEELSSDWGDENGNDQKAPVNDKLNENTDKNVNSPVTASRSNSILDTVKVFFSHFKYLRVKHYHYSH
jgi:hypothetical protein